MTQPQPWNGESAAALPVAIEVLRRGPISRADISRRLGLSHASLSRLSAPLIERGVIVDVGEDSNGRVGRPSRLLDVDVTSHYFLGAKIREHEIIAAVTDLRGEVIDSRTAAVHDRSPAAIVDLLISLHRQLSAAHPITGIGIGLGGAVHDRRTVTSANFLAWQNVALADILENALGIPALVENDVVSLCEYEDWFGYANHDDRFAVVTLGIGTGFGLVINGQPIVNDDYGLGLVGHWPMNANGPLCAHGHRGCAAALLNSDAIARYASEALGRELTFEQTLELAAENNPAATRIVRDAAHGLGILIAAICNLVLPQRIIVGGEGVRLAAIGYDAMTDAVHAHRDSRATTPPIVLSSGDNLEWARGAAVLAIQAFALGKLSTRS